MSTSLSKKIVQAVVVLAMAEIAGSAELPRRAGAPMETYSGIAVEYGSVSAAGGPLLRTIVTKPSSASGRLPAVFLAGWLSCDSVEAPPGSRDSTAKMLAALAERSGMVFFRLDKAGVGDSRGVCGDSDFASELAGYRAAYRQLASRSDVDPKRIFIFGWSNGAGFAPLVPDGAPAAGYIVAGGWVKTWFEHMMEFERRRFTLAGKSPAEINDLLRIESEFYDLYLNRKMVPGEIVKAHPELSKSWDDEPERQYGRPAKYYQELQGLNLAAAWEKVEVPVFSIHGEYDFIMGGEDLRMIADIVNARHPGLARFLEAPRMDHSFALHSTKVEGMTRMGQGEFAEDVLSEMLAWLKARAGS